MKTRRGFHYRIFLLISGLTLLGFSLNASAQFLWQFAGKSYPTRASAEAALKTHPSPQYLQYAEPWFEEMLWRDPATTLYWYTVFDYQAASDIQFYGYTVNKNCGFYEGTDCHGMIQDAVDSSYPNPTNVLCDVQFEVLGEFEFRQQQWEEALEHEIRFWARESAPMRVDFHHTNLNTGRCEHGSSAILTLHRISLASCRDDLSPITGSWSQWETPPVFPEVCSPSGHEPPMSNITAISKRLTSVCTPTEGNPCSPMTGNKTLAETDFHTEHLEITRHYNSSLELGRHLMGVGWNHNYSARLVANGSYSLIKPDGNAEEFSGTGNNHYRSVTSPGKILTVAGDLAQLLYPGGRKEIYQLATQPEFGAAEFRLTEIYSEEQPGQPVSLGYNEPSGLLETVTDPRGRTIHFEYADNNRIAAIILPDGTQIHYAYDASGNLSEVIFQDGSNKHFLYENPELPNHLTGIIDENGGRYATYRYDQYARVTLSEHAGGAERVSLNYINDGSTEVILPLGDIRTYSYDAYKPSFEVNVINDGNGAISISRNSDGWPREKTNAAGQTSQFSYDEYRLIQQTDAVGTTDERTINYSWDDTLNRKIRVDEPGSLTTYTYDTEGRLLQKSRVDQASGARRNWSYQYYDPTEHPGTAHRLRSIDGPRTDVSDITTYRYYLSDDPESGHKTGDLQTVVNSAGHVTEFLQYDDTGRLTRMRDANDVVTHYQYDDRGRLTQMTGAGLSTVFGYDPAGNLLHITSPGGSYFGFSWDDAHRLIEVSDDAGNRIEYTLDGAGNRVSEITFDANDMLHRQISRTFNAINQLEEMTDGNGGSTRFSYNSAGARASIRDGNLNTTRYDYDALNRLAKITDPLMGESFSDFDSRNNLVRVTDALGNETTYRYDGLDNPVSMTSPDSGETFNEFDAAGNRIASTNALGFRVEYRYDELNRLLEISYPDSSLDITFGYDVGPNGASRLTSTLDAAGTSSYSYDSNGRLLAETRAIGLDRYTTTYTYSGAGKVIQIEYPSGRTVAYDQDATEKTVAIRTASEVLISDIEYAPFGPVSSFTYGNGLVYSSHLDLGYNLTHLQSGTALDNTYAYDFVGNVLEINDQVFSYDSLHRLVSSNGNIGTQLFNHDAIGNRTHYQDSQSDHSYTYELQSNRLTQASGWTFTHDAAGNRSSKLDQYGQGELYVYDDQNRLSELTRRDSKGESLTARYGYDGKGQRISKVVSDGETHFIYSPSGQLLGEYSSSGEREYREYVYLDTVPVAILSRETQEIPRPGAELVIDNGEPGTSGTGSWRSKSGKGNYGSGYLFASKSSGTAYRWSATPPGGKYRVYAWWMNKRNYSEEVTYTIRYGSGQTDKVSKSHNTGGSQWQLLGTYFSEDGQDYVEVRSGNNKFVADAIRWVAVNDPELTVTEAIHFIHFDHLGTPRQVTDAGQTVVWNWVSTPFGNLLPDQDPDGDLRVFNLNLRFPGQYFDEESGLHYNHFRTYDPALGRYIESDPIGLSGGFSTYGYAAQNPLGFTDPFGLLVRGEWMKEPVFNIDDYRLTGAEIISPYLDSWGFLKFFRVFGRASGYVNIDVKCSDLDNCESSEWEIHEKINVSYDGYKDIGPNTVAAGAGVTAGPLAGTAAGMLTLGGSALTSLLGILSELDALGGDKLQWVYQAGPSAMCLGTR
jgi:RHS repeat-associated protein